MPEVPLACMCLHVLLADLTRLQASHFLVASEVVTHQARTSAKHSLPGRSFSEHLGPFEPVGDQLETGLAWPDSSTRALLQVQQQRQLELQHSGSVYQENDNTQVNSAAGVVADTGIASQTEIEPEPLLIEQYEPQSGIQQYQPSNVPVLDESRLISAAAAQASQILADRVEKTQGEDQFDVWPLVAPPFQEALHEV